MNNTLPQSFVRKLGAALVNTRLSLFCCILLLGYMVMALLTKIGLLFPTWDAIAGASREAPNWLNIFGTDILGRSVLAKVMHGAEVSMSVGFVVALGAIALGLLLGIAAGYCGGLIDEFIVWLYTVVCAIPNLILIMVVPFMLGKGLHSIYIALIIQEWTETCRLVRSEIMRQKNREYVQAASAIGAGNFRMLFIHMLPNILPLVIFQFSAVFQRAIKYEVVLSYLGFGVQNKPSWGIMINDAKSDLLQGYWWELLFATLAMFLLIIAFNVLIDVLRDTLDPKVTSH